MTSQASILLSMPAQLPGKITPSSDDLLFTCYGRIINYLRAYHGGRESFFLDYEVNENNVKISGIEKAHECGAVQQAANAIRYLHGAYARNEINFASARGITDDAINQALAPSAEKAIKTKRMKEKQLEVGIDLTDLNARQLNSWARVRAFLTETRNLVLKDALAEKLEDQPIGAREKPDRIVITQTESTPLEFLQIHFDAATKLALWAGKEIGKDHELTDNRIRHVYNNLVVDEARRRSVPSSELSALRIDR